MSAKRYISTLVVLFSTFVLTLSGQDFRATLAGAVTDPSGAAVPNATVKVTNTSTNEVKTTKTDAAGHYTVPYLNPGVYDVEVTATGFQTLTRSDIALRVADKIDLPLALTVGQMTQTINVTGDQPVLDTGDASRGLVFDPIKTQEYPLNGRQEYMLMALTPGVLFTQEQFGAGGFSGTRGWDTNSSYKINGARPGTNVFLLNGARISDNGGTWDLAPNIEAVQEFKVMTNTYDAQYGGFGGGAVNTTIQSGTNQFHGDVFDYFRNSYMDANNFANNFNHQFTPFHNQHQFGGVFGGPVRKNKDYFFMSFEGWREVLPAPATDTVPTAAMLGGNFGSAGIHIYDPLTSVPCNTVAGCSGHTFVRSEFPGDVIPANRLSPVAQKILSFYPKPTTGGIQNNFNAPNVKDQYAYNQPIVRYDHNFGDRDRIYGMFTWQHGTENRDSTGFGPPADNGNISNERTDQNYIADYTHIFTPSLVFDARLSFGRYTNNQPGWGDPTFRATNLGMTGNCAPTISTCAAPAINFSGTANGGYTELFGNGNQLVNWYSFNTWDFTPNFTWNHANHTFHIGGEVLYQARPSQSSGYASGYFNFNAGWTQQFSDTNQGTSDGNAIASLLLGYPADARVEFQPSIYITRPYLAGYVQDDWKVTSRLTLNLGLRYEVQIPWLERYNRSIYGFDFNATNPYSSAVIANWSKLAAQYNAANPNDLTGYPAPPAALVGGLTFAGVNGNPRRVNVTDWTNLAPRLGIAYRINDKTIFRGGVGVFYRQQQNNLSTQYGYSFTTNYNTSLDQGQTPAPGANPTGPYSLANPFPLGITAPTGNSLGLGTNVLNSISFNNPQYRLPRTYQASIGFERELPARINLEVSYAFNKEIYVPITYNMDNSPANLTQLNQAFANGNLLSHSLPNPFLGIIPASFGSLATNPTVSYGQLTRNYPLFTQLTQNYIQVGHYRSDMLQVKAEKRVMGGANSGLLTFVLSYTFGKQMQADHRQNNWDVLQPLMYEIDDGTKVHDLSFSGVWDLPIGHGRHFLNYNNPWAVRLTSGWRLDYIFTYTSGFPVGWPGLLNYCGVWSAQNQNEYSWFNNNKSCYASLPPNILNPYPDRFSTIFQMQAPQLNSAIEKTTSITERVKVLLRLEAFNVTNTPIRGNPSTNFSDALFGQLPKTQKNFPRTLQLGGKIIF